MIALIGSMLRVRRLQALIVTLLATVTIGTAVAIPAFLAAADKSVVANQVANAPADQRLIEATQSYKLDPGSNVSDTAFQDQVPAQLAAPGFTVIFSAETDVSVASTTPHLAFPTLAFRQDACDHVVIISGRCPLGSPEVMIDARLASDDHLRPGDSVPLQYSVNSVLNGWEPAPGFHRLTVSVVGIYQVADKSDPYWGNTGWFTDSFDRDVDAPILTARGTIDAIPHGDESQFVDAVVSPAALTVDRLGAIRALVQHNLATIKESTSGAGSQIPNLVTAIDQDRATMRQVVPMLAIPLIVLGCFVVFLAGGYAVSGRREELGVVALRGANRASRWWLGAGESILAVLIAIPCGYVLGYLAAFLAGRFALAGHPVPPPFGQGSLPYVALTFAGCFVAILAAAFRTLTTSTSELLRNVPPSASRWRAATIELVIVALAVTGVVQMLGEHGRLTGIELVAPGLFIAAVAVLAARLVTPMAVLIGSRGLRRGKRRLGLSIGALQIARRPGAARMFVLLVVAVGLVTYAAASFGVAGQARAKRAAVESGASEVVSVVPVSRLALLNATHKVDPKGQFAMAVATIPQPSSEDPPIIAVDSSRLAAVAAWPPGSIGATQAAALLRQPVQAPVTFTGESLAIDMTLKSQDVQAWDASLSIVVQPVNGAAAEQIGFGTVVAGTHTYVADASSCLAGCRVAGISLTSTHYHPGAVTVTLKALRVVLPVPATITTFSSAGVWRAGAAAGSGTATPATFGSGGMTATPPADSNGVDLEILPEDSAYPAPALSTQALTHTFNGILGHDALPVPLRQAAIVPTLPRVAANGILVDLQDVDRAAPAYGDVATQPQVWLSASAPSDTLDKLHAAGLTVTNVAFLSTEKTFLDGQGPAAGIKFFLLAVAGVVLLMIGAVVLTASVDRERRGAELRALRAQGLSMRRVRGAALFGYAGLAVTALVTGVVAGLACWRVTGTRVPVFADGLKVFDTPVWPAWTSVAWPVGVVAVVLLGVSYAAAADLRRVVGRGAQSSDATAPRRGDHVKQLESVGSSR